MSLDATLWAWKQKGLTSAEKNVLLSLADRAGENHTAWPSAKRLAQDTELSDRHVRRVLKELVRKGMIRRAGEHSSGVVIYQLVGVSGRENNEMSPPDKMSGGTDTKSAGGDKVSPKPPREPSSESIPPFPQTENREISQQCREDAEALFPGYDIDHLVSEWRRASLQKGVAPKYPDKAFLAWAERYVRNHPLHGIERYEYANKPNSTGNVELPRIPLDALEACQKAIGELAEHDPEVRALSLQIGFYLYDGSGLRSIRMVIPNVRIKRLVAKHIKLGEIIKTSFDVRYVKWSVEAESYNALAARGRLGLPGVWSTAQERGKATLYVVE